MPRNDLREGRAEGAFGATVHVTLYISTIKYIFHTMITSHAETHSFFAYSIELLELHRSLNHTFK